MKFTLYECEVVKDDEENQLTKEKHPFEKYNFAINKVLSKKKLEIDVHRSEDSVLGE